MELRSLTKKDQLKEHLRREIAGGMRAGERIMPELVLAERFNLARGTVRKAIQELVDEKLLRVHHGLGTFVAGQGEKLPIALIHELRVPITGHSYYFPFYQRLAQLANQDGRDFQLYHVDTPLRLGASECDMPPWRECGNPSLVDRLERRKLGGVILNLAPYRNIAQVLKDIGIPYVFHGRSSQPDYCVGVDPQGRFRQALDYLASQGCRKVCVAGLGDEPGFLQELAENAGVQLVFSGDLRWPESWACDGLFVSDDYLALKYIERIIAFGEYDRVVVSQNEGTAFPLPVVAQELPVGDLGDACWQMLVGQMRDADFPRQAVLVQTRLVPPRADGETDEADNFDLRQGQCLAAGE